MEANGSTASTLTGVESDRDIPNRIPHGFLLPNNGFPIPKDQLNKYQQVLREIEGNVKFYTAAEQSEANERYGVVLFYYGAYNDALHFLGQALSLKRDYRPSRSNVRINLLMGIANIRTGDPAKAISCFMDVLNLGKTMDIQDVHSVCLANLAVAKIHTGRHKEAVEKAREAIDSASKILDVSSREYLNYVRILITALIKCEEYAKAETIVEDNAFLEREKVLLLAGLKFANSKQSEALTLLESGLQLVNTSAETVANSDNQLLPADQVYEAQVKYNIVALKACRQDYVEAIPYLDSAINTMQRYISSCTHHQRFVARTEPFLTCQHDEFPNCLPLDRAYEPLVLLSQMMGAKVEAVLLLHESKNYVRMQLGEGVPATPQNDSDTVQGLNMEGSGLMGSVAEMVNQTMLAVGRAGLCDARLEPLTLDDSNTLSGDSAGEGEGEVSGPSQVRTGVTFSAPTRPSTEGSSLLLPMDDVIASRPGTSSGNNDISTSNKGSRASTAEGGSRGTKNNVKEKLLNKDITTFTMDIMEHQIMKDLVGGYHNSVSLMEYGDKETLASTGEASLAVLKTRYNVYLNDKMQKVPPPKVTNKRGVATSVTVGARQYVANIHDVGSIRAELMLMVGRFGRDDIAAWTTWALSAMGGAGYGIMGMGSHDVLPGRNNATFVDDNMGFLKDVKNRLSEVEKEISARFNNADYSSGDREARLLLNAALARVSMLLNIKKDTEMAVSTMETLAKALAKNPVYSDPHYMALSRRFRLDYEEWSMLAQQSSERKLTLWCHTILPIAKEYLKFADMGSDVVMQRDAVKRLINVYVEISNVPSDSPDDILPPHAPLDKLESLFTPSEIETKEATATLANANWLRQYGRARARQVFALLKNYPKQVEGRSNGDGGGLMMDNSM